jgi:hypothetical protein
MNTLSLLDRLTLIRALQAQFLLVTLHSAPVLFLQNCKYPRSIAGLMVFQYSFMFILFFDFYNKAYRKKNV